MTIAALIVAAGRGTRAGGPGPKQWQVIAGQPVLAHTLAAFRAHPEVAHIAVVFHPDDAEQLNAIDRGDLIRTHGGATRSASVRNGLLALEGIGVTKVLIHDGARPCIDAKVISKICQALQDSPAAAPAIPVTDALWTGADGHVDGTRDRDGLYRAQTPQGFDFKSICDAYAATATEYADDVAMARAHGLSVQIVPGDEDNLKVTHPADFARATRILERQTMRIRLGNGFDVHKFGPGDHVILCGVTIPFSQGLVGHSDADVGMHAVTDALYGAMARGDIGQHFPPSDPQWKGAASQVFLRHAVDLAAELGFRVGNVDCTLICEHPKIGPHSEAMRKTLAGIMDIETDTVSVKATTSERLGFTGRGEGIAALATATLVQS